MLNILYLLTVILFVDAGDNQTNSLRKLQPRIWGGRPTDSSSFPFYVGLRIPYIRTFCGGTLVSKYIVLTAAHCIVEVYGDGSWQTTGKVIVYFGMSKFYSVGNDPYSYTITVDERGIIAHSYYEPKTDENDIGLIKLPREATLNPSVQVAYLPPINRNMDFVGQQLFLAGWGRLGDNEYNRPTELHYIVTQIVSANECAIYKDFTNDNNICINAANRSVCPGDSGSPSVIFEPQPILIGITSYGRACQEGIPQVLTRVSSYLQWIHYHTGIPIY